MHRGAVARGAEVRITEDQYQELVCQLLDQHGAELLDHMLVEQQARDMAGRRELTPAEVEAASIASAKAALARLRLYFVPN